MRVYIYIRGILNYNFQVSTNVFYAALLVNSNVLLWEEFLSQGSGKELTLPIQD